MPISFTIDDTRRRIYSHCTGVLTYEEFRTHMNAEVGAEASGYSELFDASEAATNITPNEINKLVAERKAVAERRTAAPVAMVTSNDNLFGLLRMYDSMTEQIRPMQVFRSLAAAEQWLDEIERRWGDT